MKNSVTGKTLFLLAFAPVCLTGPNVVQAEAQKHENQFNQLSPTAITEIRQLSGLEYSVRRNQFAFVVSTSGDAVGGRRSIWVHDLTQNTTRPLTDNEGRSSHPRWCPDDSCLTYLTNRDQTTQVYKLPMHGGEPEKVTNSPTGVRSFEWGPHGKLLAYISDTSIEFVPPLALEAEGANNDGVKTDELIEVVSASSQQIWILDTTTDELSQLTVGRWRVSVMHWAPDGKTLFVAASADVDSEIEHDRIYAVDLATAEMRELLKPDREFDQITVSPDGKLLSFAAVRDEGPETFDLFSMPVAGGKLRNLTELSIDRKIQAHAWTTNDTIVAIVEDGFQTPMYKISLDGTARRLPDLPVNPRYSLIATEDVVAFLGSTFVHPGELWVSYNGKKFRQATNVNETVLVTKTSLQPQIIRYKSFDGLEIEAALYSPDIAGSGKPYPLVVLVHGGPSSRWADHFNLSWGELLVSRGFAVLKPNIRGSTGYSYDFLMSNIKDLGGGDFKDVMAGLDHLIATGVADPERIGIAGWSYGGYMAAWAVTQTDRFKVAVSGAPVTNWITEYGTEDSSINRYDRSLLGSPYDDMELYASVSPVMSVQNVATPILLICAEDDVIDPIAQCWEYHRGLKQNGVDTEYVIYKGVGHSRGSWSNWQRHDSMARVINWIQKHL